jgi:hypothetical protein
VKGNLCPACAKKHFQELTLITLVGGWWGVISFLMTPFILVNNVLQYLSYKPAATMDVPHGGGAVRGVRAISAAPPTGQRKGLAIASLVIGLIGLVSFGLFGVGAMIGLVLGGVAIWKATKQPDEYGGRGIAVGGVVRQRGQRRHGRPPGRDDRGRALHPLHRRRRRARPRSRSRARRSSCSTARPRSGTRPTPRPSRSSTAAS